MTFLALKTIGLTRLSNFSRAGVKIHTPSDVTY